MKKEVKESQQNLKKVSWNSCRNLARLQTVLHVRVRVPLVLPPASARWDSWQHGAMDLHVSLRDYQGTLGTATYVRQNDSISTKCLLRTQDSASMTFLQRRHPCAPPV